MKIDTQDTHTVIVTEQGDRVNASEISTIVEGRPAEVAVASDEIRLVATEALWPFREPNGDINLEDDPAYLDNLIELVRVTGVTDPIVLNVVDDDAGGGRRASVWDGNHHLVAARRLSSKLVPLRIEHNLESRHPGHPYHGEFDDEDLAERQA